MSETLKPVSDTHTDFWKWVNENYSDEVAETIDKCPCGEMVKAAYLAGRSVDNRWRSVAEQAEKALKAANIVTQGSENRLRQAGIDDIVFEQALESAIIDCQSALAAFDSLRKEESND